MVKKTHPPDRGDIVWVNFNPQQGSEQAGRRPALVLSPHIYNQRAGLALMCPITSQVKGYPFEVPIRVKTISGVVLADQLRTLDWKTRKALFIEKAKPDIITQVQQKLFLLIFGD